MSDPADPAPATSPASRADLAKGWFAKADSDLAASAALLTGSGPFDTACFHCQQAIEKYMKGFLAARGHAFPFTHDLQRLAEPCDAIDSSLSLTAPDILALTDYAVKLRYDNSFWPSRQDAADALAVAERVRAAILLRVTPQA